MSSSMAPENWEGEQALVQKVVKMAWREVLGGGLLRYFFLFHKTENLIMPAFFLHRRTAVWLCFYY
jgi:hypothetical protein